MDEEQPSPFDVAIAELVVLGLVALAVAMIDEDLKRHPAPTPTPSLSQTIRRRLKRSGVWFSAKLNTSRPANPA
jgi:hypothetical protein